MLKISVQRTQLIFSLNKMNTKTNQAICPDMSLWYFGCRFVHLCSITWKCEL